MPTIVINGHRLEYAWAPPTKAGAPTVVFLHEGLGCLDSWRDFPHSLTSRTGCGMLVYSRWGYGRSTPRPGRWPASYLHDEATETLPAIIAHLNLDRPILYGHSDGGSIALIAAAHRVDLVRAVITEAAHVIVEHGTVEGVSSARARYENDAGAFRTRLERYHGPNTSALVDGWTRVWLAPAFRNWDLRPLLPRVTCPVLAIQGEADEYGTTAQLEAIAAGARGIVETWLLDSCGHSPHREHPRAVRARAAAFILGMRDPGRGAVT